MKNLFIVNTPFHLLESFILSRTVYREDENYLALLRPHGYDKWHLEPTMTYLASTEAGYQDVFLLIHWLSSKQKGAPSMKKQVQAVRDTIGQMGIERAFLSCDAILPNQFLVATLGLDHFYRMDDGIWSYYTEKQRSATHRIFHQIKARYLRWAWKIPSDLPINTGSNAQNPAGKADWLYLPELLLRPSPKVLEITSEYIREAMALLAKDGAYQPIPSLAEGKYAVYLSQGLLEVEEEISVLDKLSERMRDMTLIYKPHPNDSPKKIEYIGKHLPNIMRMDSKMPVELMLYFEPNIKAVIGYQSTPLILAKKFIARPIESICIAKWYPKRPMREVYVNMMKQMGVTFVE